MVFFVCSKCGSSLKKNQVEKHNFQCRSSTFSCIDCNKDFYGNEYVEHTKCISEIERYSAKGWKPPTNHNKGEKKQNEWIDIVQGALKHLNSVSPGSRNLLHAVAKHENVPRKKAKFVNFVNNITRRGFSEQYINEVWQILELEWNALKKPANTPQVSKTEDCSPNANDAGAAESKGFNKMSKVKNSVEEVQTEDDGALTEVKYVVKNKRKKSEHPDHSLCASLDNTETSETSEPVNEEPKVKKRKQKQADDCDNLTPNEDEALNTSEKKRKRKESKSTLTNEISGIDNISTEDMLEESEVNLKTKNKARESSVLSEKMNDLHQLNLPNVTMEADEPAIKGEKKVKSKKRSDSNHELEVVSPRKKSKKHNGQLSNGDDH